MSDVLDPPPKSEAEEIERRSRIPLFVLVRWYLMNGIPLDVPLRDYISKGERYGDST